MIQYSYSSSVTEADIDRDGRNPSANGQILHGRELHMKLQSVVAALGPLGRYAVRIRVGREVDPQRQSGASPVEMEGPQAHRLQRRNIGVQGAEDV
ncbi:hypothetical protein AMK14_13460 [Streptomyces sp. TSRI0445]|nr:hypothetical protein AMK14_13460 [Streptomyces sp. TSRI0445]